MYRPQGRNRRRPRSRMEKSLVPRTRTARSRLSWLLRRSYPDSLAYSGTSILHSICRICSYTFKLQTMFQAYKDMCVRLSREKDNGKQEAERSNIPGSPSKRSPTKKGTEWRGSSRSYKDELLAITKRFWSITDVFRSEKLSGDDGARYARSLIVCPTPCFVTSLDYHESHRELISISRPLVLISNHFERLPLLLPSAQLH